MARSISPTRRAQTSSASCSTGADERARFRALIARAREAHAVRGRGQERVPRAARLHGARVARRADAALRALAPMLMGLTSSGCIGARAARDRLSRDARARARSRCSAGRSRKRPCQRSRPPHHRPRRPAPTQRRRRRLLRQPPGARTTRACRRSSTTARATPCTEQRAGAFRSFLLAFRIDRELRACRRGCASSTAASHAGTLVTAALFSLLGIRCHECLLRGRGATWRVGNGPRRRGVKC